MFKWNRFGLQSRRENSNADTPSFTIRLRIVLSLILTSIVIALLLAPETRNEFREAFFSIPASTLAFACALFLPLRLLQTLNLQLALAYQGRVIPFLSSLQLTGLKGAFNLGFTGLGIAAQSAQAKFGMMIPVREIITANILQ